MPTILSPQEAAHFVRTEPTDPILQQLMPLVDQYLIDATGHDWSLDDPVHNTAITAAGMLLVYWYDNPMLVGQAPAALSGALVQLEAEARKWRKFHFNGNNGTGGVSVPGTRVGDVVKTLVGVYGASGDQKAKFEPIITVDNQIQQTDAGDLSENQYVAVVKHPAEDVSV